LKAIVSIGPGGPVAPYAWGMLKMGSSLTVGRPTRRCAQTGRELLTGEPFVAVLLEPLVGNAEIPERIELCAQACDAGGRPLLNLGQRERLIAFWKSHVPDPKAKVKPLLDDESLKELFEQTSAEPGVESAEATAAPVPAVGTPAHSRLALRYVVVLLMLRRRLLIQDGSRGRVLFVRQRGIPKPPEGPPPVAVIDPDLDESMLLEIISQLDGGEPGATTGPEIATSAETTL